MGIVKRESDALEILKLDFMNYYHLIIDFLH